MRGESSGEKQENCKQKIGRRVGLVMHNHFSTFYAHVIKTTLGKVSTHTRGKNEEKKARKRKEVIEKPGQVRLRSFQVCFEQAEAQLRALALLSLVREAHS
jgi:actin-like ATPase involved in cell morphogenesis